MPHHPSNLYRVDASQYILRQNSRFTVTTVAAITTVAPSSTREVAGVRRPADHRPEPHRGVRLALNSNTRPRCWRSTRRRRR